MKESKTNWGALGGFVLVVILMFACIIGLAMESRPMRATMQETERSQEEIDFAHECTRVALGATATTEVAHATKRATTEIDQGFVLDLVEEIHRNDETMHKESMDTIERS